jgi:hypothetical protein
VKGGGGPGEHGQAGYMARTPEQSLSRRLLPLSETHGWRSALSAQRSPSGRCSQFGVSANPSCILHT